MPSSPWLDKKAPAVPTVRVEQKDSVVNINWTHKNAADVFRWVVYYQYGNNWRYRIMNRSDRQLQIDTHDGKQKLNAVAVAAVDRTGNESAHVPVPVGVF